MEIYMANLLSVGEGNFVQEVLQAREPVLVDFTAVWCGPCKMLSPVVEELAKDWAGKVKVVQLDIDDNPGLTVEYGVMGVPTLMLFVQGQPRHRLVGFKPKERLIKELTPHLS
jgi:thioredoxin 1